MSASAIEEAVAACQRWLHLPDPGSLYALLGTIAANRIEGDPVWLLLVGPPGGGKSELLTALTGLHDAHPTATLTEASLLSGVSKRETASDAKGGLLRTIGDFGIIVAKDFGSVLSMNNDARALVMAALREIYDGSWTRHVGTDGGKTLSWSGKVGFVGGCTPTIDRHHAVMGAMGERFLFYRLPEADETLQATRALTHAGKEKAMRADIAEAIGLVLNDAAQTEVAELDQDEIDVLVNLATLVARARSAVERDGYKRDIELIPPPEAPTRLIVMLARLLHGLQTIGLDRTTAWHTVIKAALDSMPQLRLLLLRRLLYQDPADNEGKLDTNELSDASNYPGTTTRRTLEDLNAHGLVEIHRRDAGVAHKWSLSPFARERFNLFLDVVAEGELSRKVVVCEKEKKKEQDTSQNEASQNGSLHTPPDFSGKDEDTPLDLLQSRHEDNSF